MSIRFKLMLLLIGLFFAAIGNAVFTFELESHGEEKLKWVNKTHEILNVTAKLFSALQDAETGQRGYLLATNTFYLEPYYSGVTNAKLNLVRLKELILDDPAQQKTIYSIEKEMKLKFEELKTTIELQQGGNRAEALKLVEENKGKQYMDNIRDYLNSFTNAELVLLEQRRGDFRENRAQITTLITVEIVFFIGLAIITFIFLQKNFFFPLTLLLASAKKVENGEELDIIDVVEKNEMGHLISTFFVMSKKVHKREQILEYTSNHDELTGLKNRITMFDEINDAINGLQASDDKLAVLFMDLDSFKQVNDTLGHDVGDLVLKETATRLNFSVRSNDTVFRVGGDEFLVIARNIKNVSDIHGVVANILKAFETQAMIQGKPIEISLSIGIAVSPDTTSNSNDIVKFSDIAMYAAKNDKDTSYKIFDKSMLRRASDVK